VIKALLLLISLISASVGSAQDFENCKNGSLSLPVMLKACRSAAADKRYSESQQARAANLAGLLLKIEKAHAHEVVGYFLIAAEKGDNEAYSLIGDIHREGYGEAIKDPKKALAYYAMDTTNSKTKHRGMGMLHLNGEGVRQNTAIAIKHFSVAVAGLNKNLDATIDPMISDQICEAYSDPKYNYINLVKALMWCSLSVRFEANTLMKSYYEDKKMRIQTTMAKKDIVKSNVLLEQCSASVYFSECGVP
jgi:hypothetical protein